MEIYESFRRESLKPPTAEVVAVIRDRPAPDETPVPDGFAPGETGNGADPE